jgi:hypothetical protein
MYTNVGNIFEDVSEQILALEHFGTTKVKAEDKCTWEQCLRPHAMNIPMTVRSQYGNGFSVTYFCCNDHKSLHVTKHGRQG